MPDSPGASKSQNEAELQKEEQSQRIMHIIPMFGVTDRKEAPPMTVRQKFRLFWRGTLDPFEFVTIGISAGVAQSNNDFPEYGQGAAGYGKRFGAGVADSVSAGLFGEFVFPVLLKQDPRYFREGTGNFGLRALHALSGEFICRQDSGHRSFNFSKVLGAVASNGLSNTYSPPRDRTFGSTMSRTGAALINGSVGGLLDEFWPDIRRKVLRKKD